jgi:hypothetical protein
MSRVSRTVIVEARGECDRCAAKFDGKNALAVAALHHDRTHHPVWVEQTQRTHYGESGNQRASSEQGKML